MRGVLTYEKLTFFEEKDVCFHRGATGGSGLNASCDEKTDIMRRGKAGWKPFDRRVKQAEVIHADGF